MILNVNFVSGTLCCGRPALVSVSQWYITEKKIENQIERADIVLLEVVLQLCQRLGFLFYKKILLQQHVN